jgi:NADPH:quinone reductase-like Zn-dependent oxidoreductase
MNRVQSMMKAIVAPRAGGHDSLVLTEVPVPEIGADEVLVRVRTVGVGVHDRWFMPRDATFPYPIGIEAAGIIEKVGEAVTCSQPGDRVMFVSSMQPKGGVWAEFAAVAERALVPLPDELDLVRAAALPVAGGTALGSIQLLGLEPGATVFMAGASGAIGTLAIQMARARGSRVAASASARNHDYLRSLGVELAVDYRGPEWVEQVRAWVPGGVDAALAIQPGTGTDSMRVVRDGGTLVTVSGDQLTPERGIRVAQVMAGPDTPAELARLAAEVVSGRLHVEVEYVYPFERGVEALEKTETRRARGKVVLTLE